MPSGCSRRYPAPKVLAFAAAAIPLALCSRAHAGKWWDNSVIAGDWLDGNNWASFNGGSGGAGTPTSSDAVFFQTADSTVRTITLAGGSSTISQLEIANTGSGRFDLNQTTFDLTTGYEELGANFTGHATHSQSAGTNTYDFLSVGDGTSSTGTYNLSGGNILITGNGFIARGLYIGWNGTGAFNQTGGTVTVGSSFTANMFVGFSSGVGTYTISDPSASVIVNGSTYIGGTSVTAQGVGVLNFSAGSMNVSGTLKLWNSGSAAPAGSAMNFSGGDLTVGSLDTNGHPERFNWTGGTLHITSGNITVGSTGTITTLALSTGQALYMSGANSLLRVNSDGTFNMTGGTIDLGVNDMIISGMPRADVESLVTSGRETTGDWLGTGITSSSAASFHKSGKFALGVIEADDSNFQVSGFDGQTVAGSDVIVKYTYAGDADLSGTVNFDDFNRFIGGFTHAQPARWFNGDFNYSGAVDFDDFNKFLAGFAAYNFSGIVLSRTERANLASLMENPPLVSDSSPAPEPIAACGLAPLALLLRRQRRGRK
jgi:hypothetical protein